MVHLGASIGDFSANIVSCDLLTIQPINLICGPFWVQCEPV